MFYCEPCRQKQGWPESIRESFGRCEVCGQSRPCHDTPSRLLPHRTVVEPKALRSDSWLHQPRFVEFLEAYRYAAGHFSQAAPAFSKVTPEDAYWIWKTITTGIERNRREQVEGPNREGIWREA